MNSIPQSATGIRKIYSSLTFSVIFITRAVTHVGRGGFSNLKKSLRVGII